MAVEFDNASFWTERTSYQKFAHDFTGHYAAEAWKHADLPPGSRVLDIAAGAGALALIAARAGAEVVAVDFSQGMVEAMRTHEVANLEARVMDGQALDLPDASFDAAFSMFGIMLFADWRAGLAEMARVLRPGGLGCIGTWANPAGAATNLLLAKLAAILFPELPAAATPSGMNALNEPARFEAELRSAGFTEPSIVTVSHDFSIDAAMLDEAEALFGFSPLWPDMSSAQREAIIATVGAAIKARGGALPIASPALIGLARRADA